MHEELCLAGLIGMSPLKKQGIRNCNALSHYFKIFCGCSSHTFHSYLLSLGRTPAAQHSSVIWLTKINCRSCVPRDASCPESHCHSYMTAVLLYPLQFLRQQSPGRAVSPPHTSGEYPVSLLFAEQTQVCFSVYSNHVQPHSFLCTCALLSGTWEAVHQYFHLAVRMRHYNLWWGMWKVILKPPICAHLISHKLIFYCKQMWDLSELCMDGKREIVLPMLIFVGHVHVSTSAWYWSWANTTCLWEGFLP